VPSSSLRAALNITGGSNPGMQVLKPYFSFLCEFFDRFFINRRSGIEKVLTPLKTLAGTGRRCALVHAFRFSSSLSMRTRSVCADGSVCCEALEKRD